MVLTETVKVSVQAPPVGSSELAGPCVVNCSKSSLLKEKSNKVSKTILIKKYLCKKPPKIKTTCPTFSKNQNSQFSET